MRRACSSGRGRHGLGFLTRRDEVIAEQLEVTVEEPGRTERRRQAHPAQRRQHELGACAAVGTSGQLGKRAQQLLRHAGHDWRQPLHDVQPGRLVCACAEERRPCRAEARTAKHLGPRAGDEVAGASRERPRRVGPEAFGLAERLHETREDLGAEPGRGGEVVLHGTRRHAGFARHFLERDGEIAAPAEKLERRLEQALPRVQAPELVQVGKHCDRNAIPLPS
jgi:hypothetical protein